MREMRKILCFVFAVFFATSAMAAKSLKKASFSIHCESAGINCEILGDKSSIKTIDSCDSPTSWKPAAGQAYLVSVSLMRKCNNFQKTQINCDRGLFWLADPVTREEQIFLVCDDETEYQKVNYSGSEERGIDADYLLNLDKPYTKNLCEGTGGSFNSATNTCKCSQGGEFTENGCTCSYGGLKFINPGIGCAELPSACSGTGGHVKNENYANGCECPSELNLIQTETKTGCMCKNGYTWRNPYDKQKGCVEKGKKLDISMTVKSDKSDANEKLSGAKVIYYDEDGKIHETTTDSNGVFKLSNLPNTSYVKFVADNYVPAIFAAVSLNTNDDIVLHYVAPEDAGLYYQACVLQPENPSRSASGIQVKTSTQTQDNWAYCGGFLDERDCGNGHTVVSPDNIIYECHVDSATKNGTWEPIDIQELKNGTRCKAGWNNDLTCPRNDQILYEAEDIIIGVEKLGGAGIPNVTRLSDGNTYTSAARRRICHEKISDCSISKKINCEDTLCQNLDNLPKWGVPDEVSQDGSRGDDDEVTNTETPTTCEDSGGTLGDDGTTCTCDSASGLKANADNTLCECLNSNMTFDSESKKCTVSISANDLAGAAAQVNATPDEIQANREERLEQAQANLKLAKDTEQSFANRMLGGATTAATGLGMMTAASARAEQKADADAEQDMTAYLATFKCEYGRGLTAKAGNEEITLPGGNELLEYYSEYKSLADNLKNTKKALGLRPGIEQEIVYDKAQSNLYKYASTGITQGAYSSLSRALTDAEGKDAADWNAQKEKSAQNLKTGLIATGVGVVGGIVGNYLINKDVKYQELKQEIHEAVSEVQEEHPEVIAPTPRPEEPKPEPEKTQPAETIDVPKPIQTAIEVTPIQVSSIVTPTKFELEEFSVTSAGFDSGKTTLNAEGVTALDSLVRKILGKLVMDDRFQDRVINIKVVGHTDSTGISASTQKREGYKTNKELSEKRAASVVAHLRKGLAMLGERVTYADPVGQGDAWCKENNKPKNSAECRRLDVFIEDITPAAQ